MSQIIDKITSSPPSTYVIFFTDGCYYSQKALNLLRNSGVHYKGYDIDTINGRMDKVLSVLKDNAGLVGFDVGHKTRPIIFYNGKYIGGADELDKLIGKKN